MIIEIYKYGWNIWKAMTENIISKNDLDIKKIHYINYIIKKTNKITNKVWIHRIHRDINDYR